MINWSCCSSNSDHGTRRLYSQRIRSCMGSHGQQPLRDVAVTGTALGTRTHARGIPGMSMLQSSYPSVESVLPEMREGLDVQEASGLRRATRRTSSYPLGQRWGVEYVGIHHHAVDTNGGITRTNGFVQTSSIIAVGTCATSECAGVIKQVFPDPADIVG